MNALGKSMAVLGAGPGLGQAVARRYARAGYRVILVARRREPLEGLAEELARGGGAAHVITADLADLSDVAQTLAVVAAVADGPTELTGIGFIRHKETDRIGNVVAELRRCGIDADERPDGYVVRPAPLRPAVVQTYDDHRMAMSFALLGLRAAGIAIADPACVAKTFPGYWSVLAGLGVGLR